MSSPTCQLDEYGVALIKNGRTLSTARAKISQIKWSRVLDGISTASVNLITAGADCCGQIGAVDHWNTDLVIYATSPMTGKHEVVWRGPCLETVFGRGYVNISAIDVLGWLQVRAMLNDITFRSQDVSDIFAGVWNDAVVDVDPGNAIDHSLVVYPSGTVETREVKAASGRMAWSVVGEMLDAGLDVTTFGSQILVGLPAFTAIDLADTDVIGDVRVIKDGKAFLNRAIANASRDIVGAWPPGPRAGSNGYPLVEGFVTDSQLPDEPSAAAAAKARQTFSANGVRRVDVPGGLILKPGANLDTKRVLCGQLFNFTATKSCYRATETLRLGKIDVTVTKGREAASIDLQPVGAVQGGNTL